jgi:hypothetical protein
LAALVAGEKGAVAKARGAWLQFHSTGSVLLDVGETLRCRDRSTAGYRERPADGLAS